MTVALHGVGYGAGGSGRPLVILHGLFGSAQNWRTMAQKLAAPNLTAERPVFTLDLRNHGRSPWADAMDYPAMAADVAAWITAHGLERPVLLGHSMGGKTAMTLALREPERLGGLIVVDIAPVAYRHDHHGYVQALRALDLNTLERRAEADPALAPAIPDAATRQFLLQNLVSHEGRLVWRLNLAAIAQAMDALTGFPPELEDLSWHGPTLFIAGDRSDYLEPAAWDEIEPRFPAARLTLIPGAGHRVHADQPGFFFSAVVDFLARLPEAAGPPENR